ncbi:hypothetical protein F53441_5022 [Fusarium austroafricanum]|uniref:Threonylcarbamoyl-AMP synthase n=1 Tax=Fusarium austroafricanum TaxID=2364996 RepID=A0A8H4KL30_9HYPO|nr:hypothetical protein F53441_5022 [Fusarium austroafricanum]
MPPASYKRPSTTLNDSRTKKRAKGPNDDGGDASQEGSSSRPVESCDANTNLPALGGPSSPFLGISDDNQQQLTAQLIASATQAKTSKFEVAAASVSRASTPLKAYDVCFGMVMAKATCTQSNPLPQECRPVTLGFEGRLLRVQEETSNRRIAVMISNAFFQLVNECAVTLTANVCGKKPPVVYTSKEKVQTLSELDGVKFCSLRVIVYGFLQQKDEIAAILAKDELFLQHPGKTEFDRSVKYFNPHYLLPPGQDMPEVEKLTTYACCSRWSSKSRELQPSMPEHEQSQVLQIFNTAYQPKGALKMIEPSPRLVTKLKRHQEEALVMMIEKEAGIYENAQFPTIWVPHKSPRGDIRYQNIVTEVFKMSRPPPISGGILADEMGLGKTLSVLSLICHFLDVKEKCLDTSRDQPKTTLIVTPKSTIYSWEKQIKTHIHADKVRWLTYHGLKRHEVLGNIDAQDIVLTTYETLRSDRAKESPLFEHDWARVVLDEAHKIRNSSSQIFGVVSRIQTQSRWCLTGTPIQNSLDDFGALLAFVKVPPLETKEHFEQYITHPIKKSRTKGFAVLRKVVAATCLRRTKAAYGHMLSLPPKTERVEVIEMDRNDRRLYEFFKRFSYLTAGLDKTSKKKPATNILVLISMLRLICNHGEALLPEAALKAWNERDSSNLTWEVLEANIKRCISCKFEVEELETSDSLTEELGCGHIICGSCTLKSQSSASLIPCPKCKSAANTTTLVTRTNPSLSQAITQNAPKIYHPSAKVQALIRNINSRDKRAQSRMEQPKSVVFSYWTKMLDLIGSALKNKGFQYQRIDGQSSMSQRKKALETFGSDSECNIMLASIGAAGEGIDLTAASTVHIIEPHWNPMAEAQAVDRVHRIGQQKDVDVIRYIVNHSIEEYVQWMQRDKQRLITQSLSVSEEKLEDVNEARWKPQQVTVIWSQIRQIRRIKRIKNMSSNNAFSSSASSRVTPRPGELPHAKRDALRAFEVLKNGGVIIAPTDVGYGMMASNVEAIEKIFTAKKRKAGHSMGVIGTCDLLTRLTDLPTEKFNVVRTFTEELGLTIAVVAKMKESAAKLIPSIDRVAKNGTLGIAIGEGPFSRELARLNDENGLIMIGSSANLTGQGQKFRVEDIEPEILQEVDLVIDYGRQKWHLYGRAGTILDLDIERVLRIGANYESIREKLVDWFGWVAPEDPEYDMTGKKTAGFSTKLSPDA